MTKQLKTLFVLSAMATISSLSISGNVDAATINTQSSINAVASVKETDGWKQEDGKWYYYDNGTLLKNKWFTVSKNTYYATNTGAIKTGWLESYGPSSDGKTKYWFYFNSNGKMLTGLQKIGKTYYYFYNNIDNTKDYSGPIGSMVACDSKDLCITVEINDIVHTFGPDGKALKGWKNYKDNWYYFSESGEPAMGIQTIGNKKYVFVPNDTEYIVDMPKHSSNMYFGHLAKNQWIIFDSHSSNPTKSYANSNGLLTTKGWKQISDDAGREKLREDSNWYYFNANSKLVTGWQKINNKWYYLNTTDRDDIEVHRLSAQGTSNVSHIKHNEDITSDEYGALLMDGAYEIDDTSYGKTTKTYGFSKTGAMINTGWTKIDNYWFYFKSNGEAAEGLHTLPINNKSTTKDKFYLDNHGILVTGLVSIDGKKYYFNPSTGRIYYGWKKLSEGWMYFDKVHDGAALTSVSKKISGKTYNFDKNGYCTNP